MKYSCLKSLIVLLLVMIPVSANAKQFKIHGDAVITLRNGQPCFSYPKDKEIRKGPYAFSYLAVSKDGPQGGVRWDVDMINLERKGLIEPDNPVTCVNYGIPNSGMKARRIAEPLMFNTPYKVLISVAKTDTLKSSYIEERNYRSSFCLKRNAMGETILVGTDWDSNAYEPHCLKPGESPKRSFWQKLFGK